MYYNLFSRKKQVAAPFPSHFYVPAGMPKLFIKKRAALRQPFPFVYAGFRIIR